MINLQLWVKNFYHNLRYSSIVNNLTNLRYSIVNYLTNLRYSIVNNLTSLRYSSIVNNLTNG